MLSVRAIAPDELAWFAALDPDAHVDDKLREHWKAGSGRAGWTLVAEAGGRPMARGAFVTEPLGCGLSTLEGRLAALWVDWSSPHHTDAARALLDSVADLARGVTPLIERRLNPEVHADIPAWRAILESAGFALFQEKEGFTWTDAGQELPEPTRLRFRSIADVGRDAYASAMGRAIQGTLDRNDRFYLAACGPEGWGREMVNALESGDDESWLLAFEPDGTLVGYVAVAGFEPGVSTIVHIGVVPERRGRGYVNQLLRAAALAARRRGDRSMLSDVDTLNAPMIAAMERNGHHARVRPWHVWTYRRDVGTGDAKRPRAWVGSDGRIGVDS